MQCRAVGETVQRAVSIREIFGWFGYVLRRLFYGIFANHKPGKCLEHLLLIVEFGDTCTGDHGAMLFFHAQMRYFSSALCSSPFLDGIVIYNEAVRRWRPSFSEPPLLSDACSGLQGRVRLLKY